MGMMRLLFPKWFAATEAEQSAPYNFEQERYKSEMSLYEFKQKLELKQYKEMTRTRLAHELHYCFVKDENHTENITLMPEAIKMTFQYYNSSSPDMPYTVMMHDQPDWYEEKIYGARTTARNWVNIGGNVSILPALEYALTEFIESIERNKQQ